MRNQPLWYRFRRTVYGLLMGLVGSGLVVAWRYTPNAPFSRHLVELELGTYDYRANPRGLMLDAIRDDPVVIVAIDELSLTSFAAEGQRYPWSRDVHAQLVDRLRDAGARVIGFDVNFDAIVPAREQEEPDPQDYFWEPEPCRQDVQFAEAMAEAGNVVLAATTEDEVVEVEGQTEVTQNAAFPAPIFEDAALAVGDVEVPIDIDTTVRRAQIRALFREEMVPSFSAAVVTAYLEGTGDGNLQEEAARFADDWLARHRSVLAPDDSFWIDFHGEPPTVTTVSYILVHGGQHAELFKDKIVLIGASASDLQDLHDVPVTKAGESGAQEKLMPGVEIHANAIRTLLADRFLHPAPVWTAVVSTLLLGCLTGLSTLHLRPVRALIAYVPLVTVICITVAFWLFAYRDLWVNLVLPVMGGVAAAYVVSTVFAYFTVERERKRIETAWSKRVSPEVLRQLLANPRLQQVEGRTIQATVLFSDLRGFTTLCHSWHPEEVVRRLNEIFDRMTRAIIDRGGTIDKFIGDGIMAVFGDPIPHEDHARRALLAAIGMLQAMKQLQGEATARGDQPIHMGVGVHSGELVVGDIGSELFLEYTAIGDTVSTASRLEGLNKQYKTNIICSGDALEQAGDGIPAQLLDTTTVRGRETPLQVYRVLWET